MQTDRMIYVHPDSTWHDNCRIIKSGCIKSH